MRKWILGGALAALATPALAAGLIVSANDGKYPMTDNGYKIDDPPSPDTLMVLDAVSWPPKVLGQVEIQHSVVAPPTAVALSSDEKLALVGAPVTIDPKDKTKLVPEKYLQVVDLEAKPMAVQKVTLQHQPMGVAISKDGKLALAAHYEGAVSVLAIEGKKATLVETLQIADPKQRIAGVAFTPDGKWALATKRDENTVALLKVEGKKVTYTKRDFSVGLQPYALEIASNGKFAAVGNVGRGSGDNDSVSIIDLSKEPFRTVETVGVGQSPEGIAISPDGELVAVSCIDGSNKKKDEPFRSEAGKLILFQLQDGKLAKLGEAPTGHNAQGVAFAPDGKHVLVQNYVEKEIAVYRVSGAGLEKTDAKIPVPGYPAALRRAP